MFCGFLKMQARRIVPQQKGEGSGQPRRYDDKSFVSQFHGGASCPMWIGIPEWSCTSGSTFYFFARVRTRGHVCVHTLLEVSKIADPGVTKEPRGLTERTSSPSDISPPLLSFVAALDVCVASSNASAARGDAAQAAFDRKTFYCRREIQYLRFQGVVCRPFVWLPIINHKHVTPAMQHVSNVAACRNGSKHFIVGGKSKVCYCKLSFIVRWFGQHMIDDNQLLAETGNTCQQQLFNTDGNMRYNFFCNAEQQ